MRLRSRFFLTVLLLLAACGGKDEPEDMTGPAVNPPPDPLPELDIDAVLFRVSTIGVAGSETVRWIGTVDGPLDISPEQTALPWVGYGRAFRVEWKASSVDDPIRGTRYRVSQSGSGPWLPFDGGKSTWGEDTSFVFENLTPASGLGGIPCEEGPDCPALLRFESGRHRMEVRAITADDREIDPALGVLEFEVNYGPLTRVVEDPASGPTDPQASVVASWERPDGSLAWTAVARGDTLPSGATVRVRVRGSDNRFGRADGDSLCCDLFLDPDADAVGQQALTRFFRESIRGVRDSLFTLFEPADTDSVFSMVVGPFDYEAAFRAVDEHGRRGDSAVFEFVAGFPPRTPASTFTSGAQGLLHPDRDAGPGEIPFARGLRETLSWDTGLGRWRQEGGDLDLTGTWFEIALGFRGEPDPRIAEVSPLVAAADSPQSEAFSDHVRAFAYELVHESDPDNLIDEGPGDRDDLFLDADTLGMLDLAGDRAWRIFVPDLVFDAPELFDSGTCPDANFCGIGDYLRARLGDFELRLRSRTTQLGSVFHQESPALARDLILSLADHGRLSPWMQQPIRLHLALTDDQGNLTGSWPSAP